MEVARFMYRVLTVLGVVISTCYGGYGGHRSGGHGGHRSGGYGGHGYGGYGGHGFGGYGGHVSGGYGGHGSGGYGGYDHGGYGDVGHSSYGYQPYGYEDYGYEPYGYNDYDDNDGFEDDDDTDQDCPKEVPQNQVCSMKPKSGPCKGSLTRWHFDQDAGKCKKFIFSGCGGNDNRFDTELGCELFCKPEECKKNPKKKTKKNKHGKRQYGHHDHLYATKHNIDAYLANSYLHGKRKLSVQVDYLNTPLEWQYLNQYHGLKHPLSYTRLGQQFGLGYNHNSQVYNNRNSYQSPTTHVQGYAANQQSYGASHQSPTTHIQGYAANQSYGASHQSPTTHVQGYAANHQSYGASHQSPTTHVQGYATNRQAYGALQQSPTTQVQGYAVNHQSYGKSQVGYGKSVEQTTYPNGYRQPAQNSYGPTKIYQQNSYVTNAGPKQEELDVKLMAES